MYILKQYMKNLYEVEIKSLLGSQDNVNRLREKLKIIFPDTKLISKGRQLNHYFNTPKDLSDFAIKFNKFISEDKKEALENIIKYGQNISVRTRGTDDKVMLVIKASVGNDTSSNGVKRIEFESVVDIQLFQLDQLLIDFGFTYQAKWSREREEYDCGNFSVCLDRNAGYGYVVEFEKVTNDKKSLEDIRKYLLSIMQKLEVEELAQDRLERMFAYYNSNWDKYYGTDNVFNVE